MTRTSGLLLHITSLPSRYGIGDLGPSAHAFISLLRESGQRIWQFLPVNPISPMLGNSPYSSPSAFAGNVLLVSPDLLLEDGHITPAEAEIHAHALAAVPPGKVDYALVEAARNKLLAAAFARREGQLETDPAYAAFCRDNAHWLDDYAAFCALKAQFNGRAWFDWPDAYARRDAGAMTRLRAERRREMEAARFGQYLFFSQWARLRAACEASGIQLVGDMPIYVTHDSADVWANPEFFQLGPHFEPASVAGVPPDYFSATGQRWGNPVYNWDALAADNFSWWVRRLRHNLTIAHLVRLDHFRAFAGYWDIPANEATAVRGVWKIAPGPALFAALAKGLDDLRIPAEKTTDDTQEHTPEAENARYTLHKSRSDMPPPAEKNGRLPLIAEDLGVITPDVLALRLAHGLPGMRVLQFGFSRPLVGNPHTPFNHERDAVVYTGTHDNDTTNGWFATADASERAVLESYAGHAVHPESAHRVLMRLALASPAQTAVIPVQDVLGLGSEARMNTPSTASGNWTWRMLPGQMEAGRYAELKRLTEFFGRT